MSERNSLIELANFIGRPAPSPSDMSMRNTALTGMRAGTAPRQRRSVGDLLAVVMALSARTRRMGQAFVYVDIDVFTPDGERALRLTFKKP